MEEGAVKHRIGKKKVDVSHKKLIASGKPKKGNRDCVEKYNPTVL